jgi:hypothetical protein
LDEAKVIEEIMRLKAEIYDLSKENHRLNIVINDIATLVKPEDNTIQALLDKIAKSMAEKETK